MAVTKTHPIKSTLKAAIDYICNPEKTDGKLLVSSYGCAAETADIEFAWTRRHAIDKGTNLGRHLIQAFQPGEVTPEQAHEIGMELAKEILGGRYEFVLTTHIDCDHVHNHLIFNAVSFADHKHYHSNKRSYHFIRRTSDRICKEHGLSVIVPGQDKGKSYIEYQAERTGTSYKAKLRAAIDRLLPGCHDLEELLVRLQREGYALKRGKYISARAPGQERFTRLKTLGADYAEDALTARMTGRARPSRQPKQRGGRVKLPVLVADARPDEIAVRLQLPDPAADAVDTVLADAGKPLHGVVPVLRQRQHEGQQPLRFQRQRHIPQMVVGHDRVISGLFDAENCHIRRLLSLVLKSVDFDAKSPCPASRTLPMGKHPRRHLSGALRGKNRGFRTLIDTFFRWV